MGSAGSTVGILGQLLIFFFLPQVLVSWFGGHVGQVVPAEAAAFELLQDERDELQVPGRQRGRLMGTPRSRPPSPPQRPPGEGDPMWLPLRGRGRAMVVEEQEPEPEPAASRERGGGGNGGG